MSVKSVDQINQWNYNQADTYQICNQKMGKNSSLKTGILLFITVCLVSFVVCRYSEGSVSASGKTTGYYAGTISDDGQDVLDGFGTFVKSDSYQFKGLRNLAYYYQGQYQNGKRKGLGKFVGDKFSFVGEVDDVPNGRGVGIKDKQYYYIGNWRNGVIQGYGLIVFDNGTALEGLFLNSQFIFGSKYQTKQVKQNNIPKKDGFYSLTKQLSKNQTHYYELLFCQGKPCGPGVFECFINQKPNIVYYGEFSEGTSLPKAEGFGVHVVIDNYYWVGEWINDAPAGKGMMVYKNGVAQIGNWSGQKGSNFEGAVYKNISSNLLQIRKKSKNYEDFLDNKLLYDFNTNLRNLYLLSLQKSLLNAQMDLYKTLIQGTESSAATSDQKDKKKKRLLLI